MIVMQVALEQVASCKTWRRFRIFEPWVQENPVCF